MPEPWPGSCQAIVYGFEAQEDKFRRRDRRWLAVRRRALTEIDGQHLRVIGKGCRFPENLHAATRFSAVSGDCPIGGELQQGLRKRLTINICLQRAARIPLATVRELNVCISNAGKLIPDTLSREVFNEPGKMSVG